MALRQVLKELTPPLLARQLRKPVPRPVSSWRDALQAAGQTYNSELVNRFRVDRALANPGHEDSPDVLVLVTAMTGLRSPAITDFGGSTGDHAGALLRRFPEARYVVVENPSLAAYAGDKFAPVRFQTDIPKECDIFFTSCALQYVEAPYEVAAAGFASARHACIFVRNSFAEDEKIRVQESPLFNNGRGSVPDGYQNEIIRYPHRTIIEAKLVEIARRHDFELVGRLHEPMTAWPASQDTYGYQLVFQKSLAASDPKPAAQSGRN